MRSETVPLPWRKLFERIDHLAEFEGRGVEMDQLRERLDGLEMWAKCRIIVCERELAEHDGTLRAADGKVIATYSEEHIMGRIDQGARIRAGAEKTALEAMLRMLNGEPTPTEVTK